MHIPMFSTFEPVQVSVKTFDFQRSFFIEKCRRIFPNLTFSFKQYSIIIHNGLKTEY